MILSDATIRSEIESGNLVIKPYEERNIQPSSYDIRLSNEFRVFKSVHKPYIDVRDKNTQEITELITVDDEQGIILHPGEFLLASSIEYFEFPDNIVGQLEGRSSLGRLGLIVHSTAGYFDPGFKGTATLEVTNLSRMPVKVYPKIRIGQFVFYYMDKPAERPYGSEGLHSKYQKQTGPVASRIENDFDIHE